MRTPLLALCLLSLPLFAADPVDLTNDREGESYYSSNSNMRALDRATREIDGAQIARSFEEVISHTEASELCSFTFNSKLMVELKKSEPTFEELPGALFYLRSENVIDDVTTSLLLKAHKTLTTKILPKKSDEYVLPKDSKKKKELLKVISTFEKRMKANSCLSDVYKSFHSELTKVTKITDKNIESLYILALKENVITEVTYEILERSRLNSLQSQSFDLKSYYQKLKSLRTHAPLRDKKEKSDFVSGEFNKLNMSRRQRLLENYSDLQILLMGDIVKKLRARLEATKVQILVYNRDNLNETITLEPMERFRFAIKQLRKEMTLLSLNSYFNGRTPDYTDLMTAAYEASIIPASELDEIAGLQEIWNPEKTLWQKASVWVRTFSTVATIAIPPPYGFIPALAVVVIEMTTGKDKTNETDESSLF